MTRFKGRPPTRGHFLTSDTVETLGYLLDFEDRARDGWVLDTSTIYVTLAFCSGDLIQDAREYAREVMHQMPTASLQVDMARLATSPDMAAATNLANACLTFLQSPTAAAASRSDMETVDDALCRADLYAAAWGHLPSCYRAAGHAFTYANVETNGVLHARYSAIALGLLDRAQIFHHGSSPANPMTSPEWMADAISRLRVSARMSGEYTAAKIAFGIKEAKANEETGTIQEMLSDLGGDPDAEVASDLDALLSVAESHYVTQQREQPAIIVVPSLDHLPQVKASSASNPRFEFGPLANKPLPTAPVPDIAATAATLRTEMPWAAEAIDTIMTDLVGAPYARIRPTLLLARPGVGKTRFIRRLGDVLGLHTTIYPGSVMADGSFGGTSRQWGTGRSSIVLTCIKQAGMATVLVGLDEVDKAATGTSAGRLVDALIPFLERESATRYFDPYLECPTRLEGASFIATANAASAITGPLLDRFRIIEIDQPRREHLPLVVQTILSEIRQERGEDKIWMPDLDGGELDLLGRQWKGGSLRPLRRMVETVLAGRSAFALRH